VFLVLNSQNVKVGDVSATYAPIDATCPASCPLKEAGCYAKTGNVGFQVRRLEREFAGLNGDTLAELEASEIESQGKRLKSEGISKPLRIHVSGDATSDRRASALGRAAAHWPGPVWSYTHAWRDVSRASWGRVSVLASVETLSDATKALSRGFAPAIVVTEHPSNGRAWVDPGTGVKVIPCPSQTRDVSCADCRLCFNDSKLLAQNAAIAFAAHGTGAKKLRLTVLK